MMRVVRTTPTLLIVFVLVLHRWVDTRMGWPEWATFPLGGLVGAVLIDRLLLPSTARLDARAWAVNATVAAAAGAVLMLVNR